MSNMVDVNEGSLRSELNNFDKLLIVDFWADWCGPCKLLNPILEELSTEVKAKICKVNVDDNPVLLNEFGIKTIPTMLMFKDGKKVQKIVGIKSKDELKEIIMSL